MKKASLLGLVFITPLTLTGCGDKNVSVTTLEEQKVIARENVMLNAQLFRTEDPRLVGFKIVQNGDSSQLPNCPQGDGWASVTFLNPDNSNNVVKVKCSTYSKATGCLRDDEFKTKNYAADDGRCQPVEKVPYPIPKIAQ
jgi:hypothetical protein